MFSGNKKSQYNQQMMNRAITSVTLRIVVAGYIVFIAINIINGTKSESSSIPAWVGSLIGYVFIAGAAGFVIYAIRSFLKARGNARLDKEEQPKEEVPPPKAEMTIAEKVRSAQAMLQSDDKDHNQ